MANASWALQASIYSALTGNAELTGLLGGAKVYDDVPRGTDFPYLVFGQSAARDWSTGSDEGCEHIVALNAWSKGSGRKQVHAILGAVEAALDGAALTLDGYRLVNLRHEASEARRDTDGETYYGTVRFRAVTEPA